MFPFFFCLCLHEEVEKALMCNNANMWYTICLHFSTPFAFVNDNLVICVSFLWSSFTVFSIKFVRQWVKIGRERGKKFGSNQEGCNLPTGMCKTRKVFFCSLDKDINVSLSGSAKHMRPVVRLCVCACVRECKLSYVSVTLHMLFLAKVLLVWFQSCEIIITHHGFVEIEARR